MPVLAPFDEAAVAAETQRHAISFRLLLQHAQIELHEIPADDRIGIVPLRSSR